MTPELAAQSLDNKTSWASALGVPDGMVELLAILGLQHYEQGRYADAQMMFQGAATLDANGYLGHAGLGVVALVKGDLPAAQKHLERAYALNPRDTAVCCNLGEVFLGQNQRPEGRRYLEEATALDPASLDRYANRARAILQATS